MRENSHERDSIKEAETAIFLNANRIISDTQKMRTDPIEAMVSFEEHTRVLAIAAIELIAYHTSPEQAQQLIRDIVSLASGTDGSPVAAV